MIGPKCTGFILFMSIWGTVFLAILGGLYYNQSVGLLDDLPNEASGMEERSWSERKTAIQKLFKQNAYNCWAAAGGYGALVVLSAMRAFCLCKR